MKLKTMSRAAGCFLGLALASSTAVIAQQRGGEQGQNVAQPQGERQATIKEITGVIAAGATWKLVWGGPDNADGLVSAKDGSLLFAQEQPSDVGKIDKNDKFSVYVKNTHGTGALAIDSKGRLLGAARTCTDPGGHPDQCTEAPGVVQLLPEFKVLANSFQGKGVGRPNDLMVDKKGGVYFNSPSGNFYVKPDGQVISVSETLRTNGIILSRDEKTLYVTNGGTLVALDVQPDGSVTNQRDFAKLEAGGNGDGSTIDSEGRIYVSTGPGVQVISPDGKFLGLIPSPRNVVSVAFAGPDKKTLYMVGGGAVGPDGTELKTPPGVRNNAKSIYKIDMVAQGFKGRAK
jgi:gluconolactonase